MDRYTGRGEESVSSGLGLEGYVLVLGKEFCSWKGLVAVAGRKARGGVSRGNEMNGLGHVHG